MINKNITRITSIAVCLLVYISLKAQPINYQVGDVALPSADANAFGKFGEIPVSHFNGTAAVGIPIYTIQQGPLSHSISMNYNTSGVRVAELSSWVGLGWTLSASAMVSRSVVGIRDEGINGWFSKTDLDGIGYALVANGQEDAEPDVFNFNIGGYSGKFVFPINAGVSEDVEAFIIPKQDVKITRLYTGNSFNGIRIITPDGVNYYFGVGTNGLYRETTKVEPFGDDNITGWYLAKIESHDQKHQIHFEYEEEHYAYRSPSSGEYSRLVFASNCGSDNNTGERYFGPDGEDYAINSVMGWRLNRISTSSGFVFVDFIESTEDRMDLTRLSSHPPRSLSTIEIHNGSLDKKYDFEYEYWQSTGGSNSTPWYRRLRLKSIEEKPITTSATTTSPYTFTYKGTINSLPHRLSRSIDHWGYFNGQSNTSGINIPPTIVGGSSYGSSNRNSSETHMLNGSLQRITYPTKGYTDYSFGANRYFYPVEESTETEQINYEVSCSTCCDIQTKTGSVFSLTADDIDYGTIRVQLSEWAGCEGASNRDIGVSLRDINDNLIGGTTFNLLDGQTSSDNTYSLKTTFVNLTTAGDYKLQFVSLNVEARTTISAQVAAESDVGGLRIESIQTFDRDNVLKNESVYDYTVFDSNQSSGQLYSQPLYGSAIASSSGFNLVSFRDISVIPLAGFDGYHIGYNRVAEIKPNSGATVYINTIESRVPTNSYPYVPDLYLAKNGRTDIVNVIRENETQAVKTTNNDYLGPDYENLSPSEPTRPVKVFYTQVTTSHGNTCSYIFLSTYHIRSGYNLLASRAETLDGLTTTTNYSYNTSDQLFPISESIINSDGDTYSTLYDYASTIVEPYRSTLLDQNRLLPAWKTESRVNDIPADGLQTHYKYYTNTGDIEPFQNETPFLYPAIIERYEVTTNNSGLLNLGAWVSQQSISKYQLGGPNDVGLPAEVYITGWSDPIKYEWTKSGKLSKWDYIDFGKEYSYITNGDLLSSFTDIDGLKQFFQYDDLMRPRLITKTQGSYGSIVTDITYTYGTTNKIKVKTDYGTSYDIETETRLDGLGREIEIIQKDHDNAGTGDVKTTIVYDNLGRKKSVKDARNLTTTTSYYPSPLNRVSKITNNANLGSQSFTYSSGDPALSDYTDLYITTQTDQDGRQQINYVDKIGRQLVNSVGRSGQLAHTVTDYDLKRRVMQIHPPDGYNNANLMYTYTYDGEDKLLTQKIPDKDLMTYSYDNRDLQVAMTDSNIDAAGEGWLNTEHDNYGRPIKIGFGITAGVVSKPLIQRFYDNKDAHNTVDTQNPIYIGKSHKKIVNVLNGFSQGTTNLTTKYFYDDGGRMVSETLLNNHMNNSTFQNYSYDDAHNVLSSSKIVNSKIINTSYTYDDEGRLRKSYFRANNSVNTLISDITEYSDSDEILAKTVGSIEDCNYEYNSLGWLTGINPSNTPSGSGQLLNCPTISNPALQNRLFSMSLSYGSGSNPEYSGNISQQTWKVHNREIQSVNYKYDQLNRITHSTTKDHLFDTFYTYKDGRGNIDKITRYGLTGSGACYSGGLIDNMTFNYKSNGIDNQVNSISESGDCPHYYYVDDQVTQNGKWAAGIEINSDATIQNNTNTTLQAGDAVELTAGFNTTNNQPGTFLAQIADCASANPNLALGGTALEEGFRARGGIYSYDGNGNIITDPNKIFTFKYNHLNLPYLAQANGLHKINWLYTAEGEKLRKSVIINGNTNSVKDYLGEAEFLDGELDAIYHSEGRLSIHNGFNEFQYFLKDHLGNTRIMFRKVGQNKEILQESHYYPFGMEMNGPWVSSPTTENDYLYNGKELNKDLGLNLSNYGARFYDPAIGRFISMDPLADQRSWVSPYNYVQNNPILRIDPTGALDTLPRYTNREFPQPSENDGTFLDIVTTGFTDGANILGWIAAETAAGVDETQLGGAGEKALDGEYVAAAGLLVTEVVEKKVPGGKIVKESIDNIPKPSISKIKEALKKVYEKLGIDGPLPKRKKGTGAKSTPRAGDGKKGYRLDGPHEHKPFWHIDWHKGKRKAKGETTGTIEIK